MYPLKHLLHRIFNMFNQRSKKSDEALELLENLKHQKASMDPQFSQKLKSEILSQYQRQEAGINLINFIKRSFSMPSFKFNKAPVLSATVISLIILTFFGLTGYPLLKNYQNQAVQAEKTEILGKILQNNSSIALKSAKNPSELFTVDQKASAELAMGVGSGPTDEETTTVFPEAYENYNFYHYLSTYKTGPAASQCPVYGDPAGIYSRTESYDFFDPQGQTTYPNYKYLGYDAKGNLVDYSLSSNEYRYEYKGGEYALRFKMDYDYLAVPELEATKVESSSAVIAVEEETTLPEEGGKSTEGSSGSSDASVATESVTPSKEEITNYFGENSQVEEIVQNGKRYYVVTYTFETPCNYGDDSIVSKGQTISSTSPLTQENTKKLVYKDLYEADTYTLVKQETYLNSIKDENLISSSDYKVERFQKSASEVASIFTFDLKVPVKDMPEYKYDEASYYPFEQDATKQANYLSYLKNYLQKNDLTIFTPINGEYPLYETAAMEYEDPAKPYYTDRAYYADNAYGQKQYEDNVALYEGVSYDQEFATTYTRLDDQGSIGYYHFYQIMVYSKEIDANDLPEYFFGGVTSTKSTVNLKINNETVSGTQYLYEYRYEPLEGEKIPEGQEVSKSYLVVFDYHGYKYVINLFTYDTGGTEIKDFLNLKAYDPDNNWDTIEQQIKNSFSLHEEAWIKQLEPGTVPSSDTGEEPTIVYPESDLESVEVNP